MRFRRDAPAVIVGSLVLVIAALTWASNAMFAAQMAEVEALPLPSLAQEQFC